MRIVLVGIMIAMTALAGCLDSPEGIMGPGLVDDEDSPSETKPIPGATGPGSRQGDETRDEPEPEPDTGPEEEPEQEPEQDADSEPGAENTPPEAFFEASHREIFIPFTVTFEADGWDPDGGSIEWRIDFGDGNSTVGDRLPVTVDHTFQEEGVFQAELSVTDGEGWKRRMTIIDASEMPTPVSFKGAVDLPDSVDAIDGGCISESTARALVDAFNAGTGQAADEANGASSEANATIHEAYDELNRTVAEQDLGSFPFSVPTVPHATMNYFEGPTWNYHALDPEVWGWPYSFDSGDVIAEFRANNGTLLEQGSEGVAPSTAAMMVVCAKPIPADEDELPGGIVVAEEYEMVLKPPEELLQRPGPEEVESMDQLFEGGFDVGVCVPVYPPEFDGAYFATLESIDPATHGNAFSVAFDTAVPAALYWVEFYDGDEFLEDSISEAPEWEGTVPDGATQAFFIACGGGVDISVSYVGEA